MTAKQSKQFTVDEVRRATGADDKNDYDPDILIWAASEYLRAVEMARFYGDDETYDESKPGDKTYKFTKIWLDRGQRARDWLGVKS